MDPKKLAHLTMREKIRDCEHLARELAEHWQQNFLPKVADLQTVSNPTPGNEERVADITVRSSVAAVLESERFAAEREEDLGQYVTAIVAAASAGTMVSPR